MNKKNVVTIVLGLLLGAAVAVPTFWWGIRNGLKTMFKQAEMDFEVVETRLQTMADQAMVLRKVLSRHGWRGDPSPFLDVEEKRSWLHGSFPLPLKMELAEDLERSLLKVEEVWAQAARNREHIRRDPYYRQWGFTWEKLKRLLVKEEKIFVLSASEYTAGLNHWVFDLLYNGKRVDLAGMFGGYYIEIGRTDQGEKLLKMETDRKAFSLRAEVDGLTQGAKAKDGKYVFLTLPRPYWLAEAPLPEDDYDEVQFDRDTTNMAEQDIESFENLAVDEVPVYENRHAPEKFSTQEDLRQKKVIY